MTANPYRQLPAVNDVLELPAIQELMVDHDHALVVAAIREELAELRELVASQQPLDGRLGAQAVARRVAKRLASELRPRLRPVINATGIILHTNLGRAPIAEAAAQAAYEAAGGYLNLELDLQTGKRSSRQVAVRDWICRLTGAEAATAVNNNAAATVIALRAIAKGREVIVSRGQLVEIGGSFRIPDIMAVSGATLKEVGTTNITRLADYEAAISPNTGALLRVHCSNYRIAGHTESVALADLVALGRRHALPIVDDLGSGPLVDFARWGFRDEPLPRESLACGADLVLFSGDKLLGGPQAGILAGRMDLIQKVEMDPLMRAFRLDKMTLAALETTLRIYLNTERALKEVPVLRLLEISQAELRQRAELLCGRLRALAGLRVKVSEDVAFVGGGSLPDQGMATWVLELEPTELGDADLALRLRLGSPAVVGRLRDNRLLLDVRTVFPHQENDLVEAVRRVVEEH